MLKGMSSILAAVQAQVAKEAVVWRSGPLVMAPLVKSTLAAAQVTPSSASRPPQLSTSA